MKQLKLLMFILPLIAATGAQATVRYVRQNATGTAPYTTWATAGGNWQAVVNYCSSGDTVFVAAGKYQPAYWESFSMKDGVKIYGGFAPTGTPTWAQRNWVMYKDSLVGNSNSVINNNGLSNAAVLDGFIITGGSTYGAGGGMQNSNSSPSIANCTFSGNTTSDWGGGIYNISSAPIITNCTFSGNTAGGNGGGMANLAGSAPSITGCSFSGNTAGGVGGGMFNTTASPTITNCTFSGNASGGGGGMHNLASSPTVTNCIFSGNNVPGSGGGGGMANEVSSPKLTNCTLSGNMADVGGGMYNYLGTPIINNCTIAGNRATSSAGAINNSYCSPPITNSIIFGNSSGINNAGSNPDITYSLVQDVSSGTGNINGSNNPLFVNPQPPSAAPTTAGNYRLQAASPAINAGNNGNIGNTQYDLDAAPRVRDCVVDMGAYEYQTGSSGVVTSAIYVDSANGNDANNGATWATAFKTLSYALNKAQLCNITDSILVAKGTYYPTGLQTGINRDSTFLIKRGGLKIYGGFDPANGYSWSGRVIPTIGGISLGGTILSGNINAANSNADNSYHILVITDIAATADSIVVDGVSLTAGNANSIGNFTYSTTAIIRFIGGGVYIVNNQLPLGKTLIKNCIISANSAISVGGMYSSYSSPALTNCIFSGNATSNSGFGGGMYTNSSSILTNCMFSGNTASHGGGMYNTVSSPTLTNCTFAGNTASSGGGAISNNSNSNPTISNSIISGNSSGIENVSSNPTITYSLVQAYDYSSNFANANNLPNTIDPLFVNPQPSGAAPTTAGDYRLQPCSPAINIGNNSAIPTGITTDLDGSARIFNTIVDMGAYENQSFVIPSTVYVDSANGNDTNNGTAWGTAFKTLSYALAQAQNSACYMGVDSILVAKGTYYPVGNQISGTPTQAQRDSTFLIKRSDLKILGGYDASTGSRDIAANVTTLSGDISNTEDSTQNSYHVMVIAGLPNDGNSVLVEGFTIREGNANGGLNSDPVLYYNGMPVARFESGAIDFIYNGNSSITINRCVFEKNTAEMRGGAIASFYTSPLIINCLFYSNIADNGAAIYTYNLDYDTTTIINCTFSNNTATASGTIFSDYEVTTTIQNSIIYGNNSGISGSNTVTYSLVQGMPYDAVLHNLAGTTDPLFTDAANNDYRLHFSSPAVDTGDATLYNQGLYGLTDLAGNIRILDGAIDLGAYEKAFTPDVAGVVTDSTDIVVCGGNNGGFTIGELSPNITYNLSYVYNFQTQTGLYTSNDTGAFTVSNLLGGTYSDIVVSIGALMASPLGPVTIDAPQNPHIEVINNSNNTLCQVGNGSLTIGAGDLIAGGFYNIWVNGQQYDTATVGNDQIITIDSLATGSYDVFVVSASGCHSDTATYNVSGVLPIGGIDSAWALSANCGQPDGSVILSGSFYPGIFFVNYKVNNVAGAAIGYSDGSFVEIPGLPAGTYDSIQIADEYCPTNIWTVPQIITQNGVTLPLAISTSTASDQQGAGTSLDYVNTDCELFAHINAADSLGSVTVNVNVENAAQTYNSEFYVGRFFDITAANNMGGVVTLYFSQQDFDDYNNLVGAGNTDFPQISANGENLLITAFHSVAGSGTGPQGYDTTTSELLIPNSVLWNSTDNRWEVTITTPHFSGFFAYTNATGNALPIKMGNITAINLGEANRVDWNTTDEAAGDRFEIERSHDAKAFMKIGDADAKGIANSKYSFVDATPFDGINYYRLYIINNDGSRYYSKVVNVTAKINGISVDTYPNPVSDELTIKIMGLVKGKGELILTDAAGRTLTKAGIESNSKAAFKMSHLAQGTYFVKYQDEVTSKVMKVVKK